VESLASGLAMPLYCKNKECQGCLLVLMVVVAFDRT
jgi:hypothetical protein